MYLLCPLWFACFSHYKPSSILYFSHAYFWLCSSFGGIMTPFQLLFPSVCTQQIFKFPFWAQSTTPLTQTILLILTRNRSELDCKLIDNKSLGSQPLHRSRISKEINSVSGSLSTGPEGKEKEKKNLSTNVSVQHHHWWSTKLVLKYPLAVLRIQFNRYSYCLVKRYSFPPHPWRER